jgi:UDP-glucose 4-epimerase
MTMTIKKLTRRELHNPNILVTGGAGFIGSCLIPVLLDKSYRVTLIHHLLTGKKWNVKPFVSVENFQFMQLYLLDINKLKQVVKEYDIIYRLDANIEVTKGQFDTEVDFLNNVVATRNVLESMRTSYKCKRLSLHRLQ